MFKLSENYVNSWLLCALNMCALNADESHNGGAPEDATKRNLV
ncbi:hypothetical protein Xvie_01304 [Xenorhabdus vietnamensis]|uniref:Uncharacterized protein n=1 Tax=Xenorhabdus vietnamensis TaxID=351656 RepID=A0A1Y2SE55_9GAMM|nr:hypothetical protein Xvie_01304 [Xenorhabdus vietnamensis]